jgi:hypothetical protein
MEEVGSPRRGGQLEMSTGAAGRRGVPPGGGGVWRMPEDKARGGAGENIRKLLRRQARVRRSQVGCGVVLPG